MNTINLGDKVKDRITGFTGIVVARTEWLYGCVRCTVQPQETKDGKPVDNQTIDEPQLDVVKRSVIEDVREWLKPKGRTAGPRPDVTRRQAAPTRANAERR